MATFFFGCAIGAAAAACIVAPFFLPWHLRVRYLATSPAIDPRLGFGPPAPALQEVRIAAVAADHGHLEVAVDEVGATRRSLLASEASQPAVIAQLEGWSVLRTPLLMVIDEEHRAHVYGPDGAVTNLALVANASRDGV